MSELLELESMLGLSSWRNFFFFSYRCYLWPVGPTYVQGDGLVECNHWYTDLLVVNIRIFNPSNNLISVNTIQLLKRYKEGYLPGTAEVVSLERDISSLHSTALEHKAISVQLNFNI